MTRTEILRTLIDVARDDFSEIMRKRIFAPAGMISSTFAQPPPAAFSTRAAAGHDAEGVRSEGDAHVYPEQAAAGLWTTAGDLAHFAGGFSR